MIILSFEKFDELEEKAEQKILPANYTFPTIENIENQLEKATQFNCEEIISDILLIMEKSDNKEYKKALNELLTKHLYLTDEFNNDKAIEESKKMEVTPEQLLEMTEKVKTISFQCTYWYPTVEELKNFNFSGKYEDILFLLWLINCDSIEFTKDEEAAKKTASQLLQKFITIRKEK